MQSILAAEQQKIFPMKTFQQTNQRKMERRATTKIPIRQHFPPQRKQRKILRRNKQRKSVAKNGNKGGQSTKEVAMMEGNYKK